MSKKLKDTNEKSLQEIAALFEFCSVDTNRNQLLCTLCKRYVGPCKKNVEDHWKGRKHIQKLVRKKTSGKKLTKSSEGTPSRTFSSKKSISENTAVDESKIGKKMTSTTVKSLSLKQGSKIHQMQYDNYNQEIRPRYRGQGNRWCQNNNPWYHNDYVDNFNDRNYWDHNGRNYYQYQHEDQSYVHLNNYSRNQSPGSSKGYKMSNDYYTVSHPSNIPYDKSDKEDVRNSNTQKTHENISKWDINPEKNHREVIMTSDSEKNLNKLVKDINPKTVFSPIRINSRRTRSSPKVASASDSPRSNHKIYENGSDLIENANSEKHQRNVIMDSKKIANKYVVDKDSNPKKPFSPKRINSPKARSLLRVNTASGLSKTTSPRQFRISNKEKPTSEHDTLETISITLTTNNMERDSNNDSDGHQDKILPSEKMSNRISHWLNPLNSRDKAEVDKLMVDYSKSRKKETLLKLKLRSENCDLNVKDNDNESLFQNLEELTDRINSAEPEIEQTNETVLNPPLCFDPRSKYFKSTSQISLLKPRRRKRTSPSESSCNSLDVNLQPLSNTSSIEKDLSSNKKAKRGRRRSQCSNGSSSSVHKIVTEYEAEQDELMLGKRRNSANLSNKPKKHKCSGSECAIECAYETMKNSGISSNFTDPIMNNEIIGDGASNAKEGSRFSSLSSEQKEASQSQTIGFSVVENAQILNVEDLMKVFALQNVTIKKEFDDPLIEAMKNVDVNFLMNACDQQSSATSEKPSPAINKPPKLNNCINTVSKSNGASPQQLPKSCVPIQSKTTASTSDSHTTINNSNCDGPFSQELINDVPMQSRTVAKSSDSQFDKPVEETPSSKIQPESSINGAQMCDSTSEVSSSVANSSEESKPVILSELFNKNMSKIETFETAFPGLSPFKVYVNISNELNKLQKEEEVKRTNLKEVEKKIEECQKTLYELSAQKIKLQTEEENLISRRKSLTSALSQCIISDSYAVSIDQKPPCKPTKDDMKMTIAAVDPTLFEVKNQLPEITDVRSLASSNNSTSPISNANTINSVPQPESNSVSQPQSNFVTLPEIDSVLLPEFKPVLSSDNQALKEDPCEKAKDNVSEDKELPLQDQNTLEDNEDIVILPTEKKITKIPVIDLVDLESPTKSKEINKFGSAVNFSELTVHETVVNSIKVHEGYLYTCSNDFTAKRFNLKNPKDIVSYRHVKRNVLQLCVETFNDSTIVFTLCSLDKHVSSFSAEDGLFLKSYTFESGVASIASGWGRVYAGLKNGLIVMCNRKDSKDLVRNLEPVKSLACTFQGGLHVIIILSTHGQVAVRDVQRNGLLIRYIRAHNDTPLFMNVYNDYVYLSSSVLLTASNLSTGNVEKQIKLTSPITGLAAFESNIFTSAFSGIVRCYSEGKAQNMKMAYGAGHNSLTCIYVHQGWVFTGNRNGDVSVFKFDTCNEYPCQFGLCRNVYIRPEDLEHHLYSTTAHNLAFRSVKCPWRKCPKTFNKVSDAQDKKDHLETHIRDC